MRIFLALTAAFAVSTGARASVTTFDNLTDFTNALPAGAAITTDPFDNNIAPAETIMFDSGVMSSNSPGLVGNDNSVAGGLFINAVDNDGADASETITFVFPDPIIGLGFDMLDVGGSTQLTLDGGAGPETFVLFDVAGGSDAFAGFIGDDVFTAVVFSNASTSFDGFGLDNLLFATVGPDPSVVPLPAAAWLFLAALGGLGAIRRRAVSTQIIVRFPLIAR